MDKKWFAVYTKPRWEKKVYQNLSEKNIEAYCPLNRVQKQWSDRKKIVEEPLFKSYVFVRIPDDQQTEVRMVRGIVNFVYWLGKPVIVKDKEITVIKKFLDEHENVEVERTEIHSSDRVQIRSGAFMDKEGTVLSVMKNKVRVVIESIGFSLIANIDRSKVVVLKNK